jgi:integrase
MPIVKLTQIFINNDLRCPEGKGRTEMCCFDQPGLYVEVRSTSQGQGTFYWRYKDLNGKTCHQKIGRTSDISLADARKQAKLFKAEIALGADPRGEHKKQKAVLTYGEFFEDHYLPFVKPRKRSWKRDEELYRLRIKDVLGSKKINLITRQQIQSFHTDLKAEGLAAATANHHIKLIKHSLNLAIEWDMLVINPAARISLMHEDNHVEHYMDDAELGRLLTVLRTDENRAVCKIALFLLSTGCRLNEVLSGRWSDLDLSKRVFVIRASNSKSKKLRSVPLNDSAIEVLNSLETKGVFEFLFINMKTGLPYTTISKVFLRIRNKAELPKLRIHDLRHQYASFLVNDGRTLYEVQQILGHSDPKVTMRYSHLNSRVLQAAANSASLMIRGVGHAEGQSVEVAEAA